MTHPISHQNLFPAPLKQNVPRTESSATRLATPVPAQLPGLQGKKTPLLSLPGYQLKELHHSVMHAQPQSVLLNPNHSPHSLVRAYLHTDVRHPVTAGAQLGSQVNPSRGDVDQQTRCTSTNTGGCPPRLPLREKAEGAPLPLRGSPIQQDLQGRGSSPVGDQVEGGEGRVDHRLLTVKLGGWVEGLPNHDKLSHRVGVEGAREGVSLHVAPQALPGCVIKLVNQLMRHGKKGVSVGLLADSLPLFSKRLEEGGRSNLRNAALSSAILPQQVNGQGRWPSSGEGALPKEGHPLSKTPLAGALAQAMATHSAKRAGQGPLPKRWPPVQRNALGTGPLPLIGQAIEGVGAPAPVRPGHRGGRWGCPSEAIRGRGGMAVGLQGIPSFPFYLTSFPGASFNEIFSDDKGRSNALLGLPFSATLPMDSPWMRLSFLKGEGEHRGSLGFKGLQSLGAGEGRSAPYICKMSPFSYASDTQKVTGGERDKVSSFSAWEMPYRTSLTLHQKKGVDEPIRGGVNPETAISAKRWALTKASTHASQNDVSSRIEVGLRFHTIRPTYFWPMRSPATSRSRMSHRKTIKVEQLLAPLALQGKADGGLHCNAMQMGAGAPKGLPRLGVAIPPQASVLSYLCQAIANVEPALEVRKKKIAGITRQIPCVLSKSRGERLAIRWIINSARERAKKRGKGLASCLAEELVDAYNKRGDPRQRRDSLHKLAESNRSFLRYRWW